MNTTQSQPFVLGREYLFAHGRELDRARYEFLIEDGSADAVVQALGQFQNEDGGFGHALEPDIRTPASSVIATVHALEILHEVGASADSELTQTAVAYLLQRYDADRRVWPMVGAHVEDAPHAPWWSYDPERTAFGGYLVNPTAAVIAHLLRNLKLVPDRAWLEDLAKQVVARIDVKGVELDLNEMHPVLALHDCSGLGAAVGAEWAGQLQRTLATVIPTVVVQDPARWHEYVLQPLDVAPTPEHYAAQILPSNLLDRNLDYWLETQLPDGSWPVPWNWAFVDAAAWEQAERDWKGHIIVKRLQTLAAYGRG